MFRNNKYEYSTKKHLVVLLFLKLVSGLKNVSNKDI